MKVHHAPMKGDRALTVEDLWAIPRVGTPAPSPTEPVVAVAVKSWSEETHPATGARLHRGRNRIWLLPAGGGEPRPLTAAAHDSLQPVFSPDGSRLAFVREVDGKKQLHVMPLDGGEPERVIEMPLGVTDPRWLADGSALVFVAELLQGHLTPDATREELARRQRESVPVMVTEDRLYRFWDHDLVGGRTTHLFRLDLGSRALLDLTPDWDTWFDLMDIEGCYDLSPDGSEAAFSSKFSSGPAGKEELRSAIYAVSTTGGTIREVTGDRYPRAFRPRYTRDGAGIVYGWTADPFFYADRVRLACCERADGTHRDLLADWDLSPEAWELGAEGEVYLSAEIDGRTSLFVLADGVPRRLTGAGTTSVPRPGWDGKVYFSHQTLQAPPEVWGLTPGNAPIRFSHFTDRALAGLALGEVRELEVEGAEGERVQTWVVLPPDHREGDRRPLVHVIHGGPHGISADMFHWRWNPHLFAAPGYVTACVNFQGSTSRGQDFAKSILGAWGDRPYRDVMAVTDALVASGLVDGERMAVAGGSYGGYLVSWIATQTNRFRCIVNHAGVFDLLAQYACDVTHGREHSFGGTPWDGLENIDRWNPARHTRGMVTPMLILHGEKDYRVPVTQGLECYNMLKAKGVPARLVVFPDENHWVLRAENARLWYGEVLGWLARFLEARPIVTR